VSGAPTSHRTRSARALAERVHARDLRLEGGRAILAGAALGALAVAAKVILVVQVRDPGYVLMLAAVVVAAWIGGVRGGLSALLTSALVHGLLLVFSPADWAITADSELFKEAFYLLIGSGTVLLIGSRREERDRLAVALKDAATLAHEVEVRDQRLELVLASSGTGFWEWDMSSGRLDWSEAIYRQHGIDPAEDPPDYETYLGTIHEADRARFGEAISAAVADEGQFDLEFRIRWPDGSIHWTRGSGRVFRDGDGRPVRMVGTGQDITERRRLEEERIRLLDEERRARQFREAFVDVISHELRTPITTILGLTQILAKPGRHDEPEARVALLSDVRAEAERLHRLIEDLLVLSRVEHGRLVVETEPIEPRRLIERVVTWETAEHPSIAISLEVASRLPIVAGEATYVEQVVRNLLDNAAKYSPPGTPVLVSAEPDADGVVIRVVDDGPGISEATASRLFELFYRDPDRARTVAGSGIGLFVCASLVQAMGGRIWARRRPEGGSEFGFTLRTVEADDDILTAIEPNGSVASLDVPASGLPASGLPASADTGAPSAQADAEATS
jgi:PAS domain S-box-containing protein